jgi:hypothetical protein
MHCHNQHHIFSSVLTHKLLLLRYVYNEIVMCLMDCITLLYSNLSYMYEGVMMEEKETNIMSEDFCTRRCLGPVSIRLHQ